VKGKPTYLEELSNNQNEIQEKRKEISEHILLLNKTNTFLDSITSTKRMLEEKFGIQADENIIGQVMKHDLGMRYRKIKPCALNINSP
jgi:cell shape-determining protein MreC